MSHTPGPWMVSPDDRPGMAWNLHVTDKTDENTICFMAHTEPDDDNATGEANARLIAAAPELLEAAKEVAEADFRAGMPADWEGDPLTDACQKLRAAIAKAEGR